jgi:hypothetical protein
MIELNLQTQVNTRPAGFLKKFIKVDAMMCNSASWGSTNKWGLTISDPFGQSTTVSTRIDVFPMDRNSERGPRHDSLVDLLQQL